MSLSGTDPDRIISGRTPQGRSTPGRSKPGRSRYGRSGPGLHWVRVALATALVLPTLGLAGSAQASPESDLRTVQARVEKLRHEAEVASEKYNDIREELKGVKVRVKAARTRQQQQQQRVDEARRMVGQLAAESYRNGDLGTLELYLGDDPDVLLSQVGVVETLADRQVAAVNRLKDAQRRLTADTADLGRQEAKVSAAEKKLGATKKAVDAKLADAQALLSRLTAAQRSAMERASRAAERRAIENASGQDEEIPPGSGTDVSCGGTAVVAPSERAATAIRYACAQLGDRYLWGAEGPDRWDCSGLTLKAWGAAGVSLPHSSKMQAGYGTRVSSSSLRAGDLVFFYSPISHVGIYLGKGLMVHAPHSGDVVKVAPVRYSNLTAAVRL